jgi:Domain of unknown function (DUF4431)
MERATFGRRVRGESGPLSGPLVEAAALPPTRFEEKETRSIHVYSSDEQLQAQIGASKGKRVVVTGDGFQAHTLHHHRPIVVDVKLISVE